MAHLNKGFVEVFVNLIGIEAVCSKCRSSFPSKSKLHRHIKSKYVGGFSPFSSTQASSSIFAIISKAVYQFLGSGFGFGGRTYAIAAVTLTSYHLPQSSDPDFIACLNTNCAVTLVNRDQLLKHLSDYKISTLSIFLKVKDVGTSKNIFAEFTILSLYFSNRNITGKLIYASFQYKIHFVERLQVNMLIDNNIEFPEAVVMNIG